VVKEDRIFIHEDIKKLQGTEKNLTAMQVLVYSVILFFLASNLRNTQGKKECKDLLAETKCSELKKQCKAQFTRMQRLCPKTCNFCDGVCLDVFELQCKVWVWHGACRTHTSTLKKYCKKSCGFCGASAPPKKAACEYSQFGCCWDKVTKALGPNNAGCRPCKDAYRFCPRFFFECIGGRNRIFMRTYCPQTCQMCKKGTKIAGSK